MGTVKLNELRVAVEELGRPGRAASAAINARTALLTMGRELYHGPSQHTSPITGAVFRAVGEKNQLRAYLDILWERSPADRRLLLEAAHGAVEEAYELGSKAKHPAVLTTEEAIRVVQLVYQVAKAIAVAGGFPV